MRICLDSSSEDAIDKLGRGFAAKELGEFNSLVYRGPERHCSIAVQGFIESDAQNIAINRRHLRQRLQRRPLLNQTVDGRAIGQYAVQELLRVAGRLEQNRRRVGRGGRLAEGLGQTFENLRGYVVAHVHLVQRLK